MKMKHAIEPDQVELNYSAAYIEQRFEMAKLQVAGIDMEYAVVIEEGESNYSAFVPDLPGCIAAAKTKKEVKTLIQEAIKFHVEGMNEEAQPKKTTKPGKRVSRKTEKYLFSLSGNRCAYPGCPAHLVEGPAGGSDEAVTGAVCHIHATRERGPRWNSELSEEEINSEDNLILLCQRHHVMVDSQPEAYPAVMLKEWKRSREYPQKEKQLHHMSNDGKPGASSPSELSTDDVDKKLKKRLNALCRSLFYSEFDSVNYACVLAEQVRYGELSWGNYIIRCQALAWCVRCLSTTTNKLEIADEYLNFAKMLEMHEKNTEIVIASAFLSAGKGYKDAAVATLEKIDSPLSRSAAFIIITHYGEERESIDWLNSNRINIKDLDSYGKYILLLQLLELGDWDVAWQALDGIYEEDYSVTPALYRIVAFIYLLSVVRVELHAYVLNHIPISAKEFPLTSNPYGLNARRKARHFFIKAKEVALELDCSVVAAEADEYAIWLELRDPDKSHKGGRRLADRLCDLKSGIRYVPLGLQFGVKLDLLEVEKEIQRQRAPRGIYTRDGAMACLALAMNQRHPEDVVNYIDRHYEELSESLDKKALLIIQIDMLVHAGLSKRANEYLEVLLSEGISQQEEDYYRGIIPHAEETDRVEMYRMQFDRTEELKDLIRLVREMENREDWIGLCKYADFLFQRTEEISHGKTYCMALWKTHQIKSLVGFLGTRRYLIEQSDELHILYCWALYYEGSILQARSELNKLRLGDNSRMYRELHIKLEIHLGNWDSLPTYIANEYKDLDGVEAQELIQVAALALPLDSRLARRLIFAAAAKSKEDANILIASYNLASSGGWEKEEEVALWFSRAVELSGKNGPVQQVEFREMCDQGRNWQRQESDVYQRLSRGEISISVAAQSLNRHIIDLIILQALNNQSINDPRYRDAVLAYSGRRRPLKISAEFSVGMDSTALFTLSYLGILEKALDSFNAVYLPHGILEWLFEQRQNIPFHQPSLIEDAGHLQHLLATDVIEKFSSDTKVDQELVDQVGKELAVLIAEAEIAKESDTTQHVVVRSSPIYRVASLMKEEADIADHAMVVSSCLAVVEKLRQMSQITNIEEERARAFFLHREKPWANQPEITNNATLYLDALSVDYFLHLEMLEKLSAAGFRLIVPAGAIFEANKLVSYGATSEKVNNLIEQMRFAISERIRSGKIKLGSKYVVEESEDDSMFDHPADSAAFLAKDCDAIVLDDRFFNKYSNIDFPSGEADICTTLDIMDMLVVTGSLTLNDMFECKTKLRRSGYMFIPIYEDELEFHLSSCAINDGGVVETAELRAVRENISHVQMGSLLQSDELPWFNGIVEVFTRVLRGLWSGDPDTSSTIARSNWIVDQIDVRGWAHVYGVDIGDDTIRANYSRYIFLLHRPPLKASNGIRIAYWKWLEKKILASLKQQYPDMYSMIVALYKDMIAEIVDVDLVMLGQHEEQR